MTVPAITKLEVDYVNAITPFKSRISKRLQQR